MAVKKGLFIMSYKKALKFVQIVEKITQEKEENKKK